MRTKTSLFQGRGLRALKARSRHCPRWGFDSGDLPLQWSNSKQFCQVDRLWEDTGSIKFGFDFRPVGRMVQATLEKEINEQTG